MNRTVYEIGDILSSLATTSGYQKGDIFKITDLRGLSPGAPATKRNAYWAVRLSKDKKSWELKRWAVYHQDLDVVKDRKDMVAVIELEINELESRHKKLVKNREFFRKYKSDDDYRKHMTKEMLKTSGDIDKIRNILESAPSHIL